MSDPTPQDRYAELLHRREELHPDLQPYIVEGLPRIGKILEHPLVREVPYHDALNALINERYRYKVKALEEAEKNEQWARYITLHEPPHRFNAFRDISDNLSDKDYWDLLGDLWVLAENLWQVDFLDELLESDRTGREHMMSEREREAMKSLPNDWMYVYRGYSKKNGNAKGFSWTLSPWQAFWFSQRLNNDMADRKIAKAKVWKSTIIALKLNRGETEVIVNPNEVEVVNFRDVTPPQMKSLAEYATSLFGLNVDGPHGPRHWRTVYRNGMAIAKADDRVVPRIVQLFAFLHDCKRQNESDDPEHGKRAADLVRELQDRNELGLMPKQAEKLAYACEFHEKGMVSEDPTIGACWDADRLDLVRVGILPDPKLLSTKAAVDLMFKI